MRQIFARDSSRRPRGLWHSLALTALVVGCAVQGFVNEDAGASDAAAEFMLPPPPVGGAGGAPGAGGAGGAGNVGGMMGQGGAGAMGGMMGGTPGGMMGQGGDDDCGGVAPTCQPGTDLGLCEVCNACGQPDLDDDDDDCPQLNCRNRATYEREGDRCVVVRPMLTGGRCLGPGSCRDPDDATACGESMRATIATLMEPCTTFDGCTGQEGPEIVAAPNGTVCGEMDEGLCRGGACDTEVGEECAAFGGQTCEIGVHTNGDPFCQVAVEGEMNCIQVCQAGGGVCLLGWSSADGCVLTEEVGCITAAPRLICRCSRE